MFFLKTFESVQLLSLSDVVYSICNVKLIKVVRTLDVYINMPKEKKNNNEKIRSCMFSRYHSFFYALHGFEKHRWIMSGRTDL